MKIFICPVCQKPQECSDKVGDSCKVYHAACAMENTKEVRENYQKTVKEWESRSRKPL
jgi:hypothetical protein